MYVFSWIIWYCKGEVLFRIWLRLWLNWSATLTVFVFVGWARFEHKSGLSLCQSDSVHGFSNDLIADFWTQNLRVSFNPKYLHLCGTKDITSSLMFFWHNQLMLCFKVALKSQEFDYLWKMVFRSLKEIQCFAFRNLAFSSLRTDIWSKNFLSMGSNTGQTGVTIFQHMRYAKYRKTARVKAIY